MPPLRILIIDDEPSIIDNLVYVLNQEGMASESVNTGTAGLNLLKEMSFDLVILDIGLPDISGIEVCKKIRSHSNIPIIFLTARSDEIDRILGLELGGDDYVTKPFSPREVVTRIKTVLRRIDRPAVVTETFDVDEGRKEVRYKGARLTLTPFEFGILSKLLSRPGQVFSRDHLLDQVWSENASASDRVIDTHIKSIRAKLHDVDPEDNAIQTHRGFGYSVSNQ